MTETQMPGAKRPKRSPPQLNPPWPKGVSANPDGRPIGARQKLCERYLMDLQQAWETYGPNIIAVTIKDHPEVMLKVIASLLPKDMNLSGAQGEQWLEALENFNQIAKAHRAKLIEQKVEDEK